MKKLMYWSPYIPIIGMVILIFTIPFLLNTCIMPWNHDKNNELTVYNNYFVVHLIPSTIIQGISLYNLLIIINI